MKTVGIAAALLVVTLALPDPARSGPYDDAPDFIRNARLAEMTWPPSYNLYVQYKTRKQEPIDIWYRVRFDDSGSFVSATPVYSTSHDSALIRSMNEFPSWRMFRPGEDSSLRDTGYLVRLGLRSWVGKCDYQAVPDIPIDSTPTYDSMPELLWSDSVPIPSFFLAADFRAEMRVRYYINEYGDICCVMVAETSGLALFDLIALDIAESWHYRPAVRKGKPEGIWMNWLIGTP